MKRFLSIFIALILVFSIFSVTAIAFAEEGDGEVEKREVTFNYEKFKEYVFEKFPLHIEMSEDFMLDGTVTLEDGSEVVWYKNEKILKEIFEGINYIELLDEDIVVPEEGETLGDDVSLFEVVYDLALPDLDSEDEGDDEVKLPTTPETKKYQATEHVKLAAAPVLDGWVFAGWTVEFEGRAVEFENYEFPAEFEFNMPEKDVKVTANWIKKEEGKNVEVTLYSNDEIYVLYVGPSSKGDYKDEMKDWERCAVTGKFNLTQAGWWNFRFAVVDGLADNETFSYDNVLATTYDNRQDAIDEGKDEEEILQIPNYTLRGYAGDVTHPVVELSEAMKNKAEEGLTVGTAYTVSTSLDIKDASGYKTPTYLVYKMVGKNVEDADQDGWLLIYDSSRSGDERLIKEGYGISVSGVITPLAGDESEEPVYKIVYSVVDNNGFYGVKSADEIDEEYHPVLLLKVKAASKTPDQKAIEAWKIVLYVIAGLAAVGIAALIFIKPKQKQVADARFNSSAESNGDANDASNDSQE